MGLGSTLALIIIAVVAFSVFGNQLTAFAKDQANFYGAITRDNNVKIPPASEGLTVYDLVVTVSPKWNSAFGTDYLFLNEKGGTVTYKWQNPHLYKASFIDMSILSLFSKPVDLQEASIFIPVPTIGQSFELSFVLVDPETGLQKKIPEYQNIPFNIPTGQFEYTISQPLKFKDLIKKDYVLWIIPSDGAFNDHAEGEAYKQKISG